MTDFDRKVLDFVNEKPGYKASTIALLLEVDAALVNASLRGPLRGKVRKAWEDRSFRWYPRQSNVQRPVPPPQATPLDTPLARLCRYYLDCLSHDDRGGVSVFAVARPGTSDYAELPLSPFAETFNPFDAPDSTRLLGKVRNNPNQLALFVGYPVRLRHVQTQRWSGFFVEPIMLFPFQELQAGAGNPRLSDDLPLFNFKALSSLGNTKDTSVIEESFRLSEELGLECDPADAPDIEELLERLREVRPGWDWQEEISANTLSEGVPLPEIQRQGIFKMRARGRRTIKVHPRTGNRTKGTANKENRRIRCHSSGPMAKRGKRVVNNCRGSAPAGSPAPELRAKSGSKTSADQSAYGSDWATWDRKIPSSRVNPG